MDFASTMTFIKEYSRVVISVKYILWPLVGLLPLCIIFLLGPHMIIRVRESSDMVKMIALNNAMSITVEGNLESEGGFIAPPSSATEYAEILVERFRSADSLSEEEKVEIRETGVPVVKITYEIGDRATRPFEITVEPDETRDQVIIRAWGSDLSSPVEERTVKVSP